MTMNKLTKSRVNSLKPKSNDYFEWDGEIRGLGIRVYPSGSKVFLLQYRFEGRTHRLKLGKFGSITAEKARQISKKYLGQLADGVNPKLPVKEYEDINIEGLCNLYLEEGLGTKKKSTIEGDKGRIRTHIVPLLGTRRVVDVKKMDIEKFMKDIAAGKTKRNKKNNKKHSRSIVRGGKGTATRTVGLLGGIMTFAVNKEIIDRNPVQGIKKFPDKKIERLLSEEEWARLGNVLYNDETIDFQYRAAILLLAFTGCRRGEVVNLEWSNIDLSHGIIFLPDSKTGQRALMIGDPAVEVFEKLQSTAKSEYVFPGHHGLPITNLSNIWLKVCKFASIENCRLHDLRHQFASIGVATGKGDRLHIVGTVMGHKELSTTQRYAHMMQGRIKEEATAISTIISNSMQLSARD